MKQTFLHKTWLIQLLLFIVSFCIYVFYFQYLVFHLNSVLFKIDGDSLKNYYTFVYHIRNDTNALEFSGLNFPFGEHIVYTDCQPLITFILRLLPFTHDYLIGIMHGLILLSFIITPLLLFRIFLLLDLERLPAFFFSLGIALLSPQIHRLGGHFALAYGCVIPLAILFILNYFKSRSNKLLIAILIYNTSLFLIHPYLGLGISFFCFSSFFINELLLNGKTSLLKKLPKIALIGLVPIVCFKLFMFISDHHTERPTEAYGPDIMTGAAKAGSIFIPYFGPFDSFLQTIIKTKPVEWETCSYLGFFPILLLVTATLTFPFYYKKIVLKNELIAMFITSVLFLIFSFGIHISILRRIHVELETLNQFRVLGRFTWYFYFLMPVFLAILLSQLFNLLTTPRISKLMITIVSVIFCSLNMLEANFLFINTTKNAFHARNIFNESVLTDNEKEVIKTIRTKKAQAIVPFPLFHIGSEVFQRNGDKSIAPSMMYSFHTRLPVLSVMLSRTSLPETQEAIELLNIYKRDRKITKLVDDRPFLVIQTDTNLKEDELRILKKLKAFQTFDKTTFYYATKRDFAISEKEKNKFIILNIDKEERLKNTFFLAFENRKPFTETKIDEFEKIIAFDSSAFDPGNYTVSFKYHLTGKKFRHIYNNLIIEKSKGEAMNWEYYTSVRSTSGFYGDVIVFEHNIKIEQGYGYRFLLKGGTKERYTISDFLIQPADLDLKIISNSKTSYNNYPG